MTALLDTNVVMRHLVGEPAELAHRATAYLARDDELLLTDVIVAEIVFVLEARYDIPRAQVAELIRTTVALPSVVVSDETLILRALEVYVTHRVEFAEAYLVACAERRESAVIASFDRSLDRVPTVTRLESA